MTGIHISGVLVRTWPELTDSVRTRLEALPGVEVQAIAPEGRLVTTVEQDSDAALANVFQQMQDMAGVLTASLVYHYNDTAQALDEEITS
jgi:nitrate reductase NapD